MWVAAAASFACAIPAAQADTFTFANPTPIALDSHAQPLPYPSTINVAGLAGYVTKVTATFSNLSFADARLIDVLLVGPGGQSVVLMSDACYGIVSNLTPTFDDAAVSTLPAMAPCTSGTYRPTDVNSGMDSWDPPAPAPPYGAALASFNTVAPNGIWSLYVHTDTTMSAFTGSMAGGWSLRLTGPTLPPTPAPPVSPGPTQTADTQAPTVTRYAVTNRVFKKGKTPTPATGRAARKVPIGTTFRYTLSEAGTVKIDLRRVLPGRKAGKRCVAPSPRLKGARKCNRAVSQGKLTRTSRAGANSVAFSGLDFPRFRRHCLTWFS